MYHALAHCARFSRYAIAAVIGVVCVISLMSNDSWFLSTGDRAISRMKLSWDQPPPTDVNHHSRANATLISLVRNSELKGMLSSMNQMEQAFNSKFKYPWLFFNDVPFTDEFKQKTQAATQAPCTYEIIPREHWDVPEWIDRERMETSFQELKKKNTRYADNLSYRQMCRWFSGFFFRHPALDKYKYYWRVEPDVSFFCDLEYDVFDFMASNNKTYGFTLSLYDDPDTVASLWPTTTSFLKKHPDSLNGDNSLSWLTDTKLRPEHTYAANGYSTCHFWSNFEIGDLDFWRSPVYTDFFDHLDRTGNFFYERWGDAPVHSVALGLFAANEQIHWFRDVGYYHEPFSNCPEDTGKCHGCTRNRISPGHRGHNKEDCRLGWLRQLCESKRRKEKEGTITEGGHRLEDMCRIIDESWFATHETTGC